MVSGDTATFTETFDTKDVGTGKTLTPVGSVNDGNGGNNYTVSVVTNATGSVSPRPITVTATASTKAYDGTISASAVPTITGGSLVAGDTRAFSETFNNAQVGTGKTLTPTGTISDSSRGANYSVVYDYITTGTITLSHFVVTVSPTTVTAGSGFLLSATLEDTSGNIVRSYGGTVDFTSSDPLEPHPAADLTFTPGVGIAATLATLETASASGWSITATDTVESLVCGTSASVTVTAASASQIVFTQQPPTRLTAGTTIGAVVDIEDPYGNRVTSSTANVTLAIASGPAGGTLLGTTTVSAVAGGATFSNLSIDQSGSYTLKATPAGIYNASVTSNSFNIGPASAAKLAFTSQPANTLGANAMANVVVAVEDQYGNTATTDNSSVTLLLNAAASGGGVLQGTTTATAVSGVATFSGLSIVDSSNSNYSAAGTGYTLTASDGGLTSRMSSAFNTTFIVTSCTMTPTGFTATFSQPFKVATTPLIIGPNLYSASSTNNLPVNVPLIGGGTVTGYGLTESGSTVTVWTTAANDLAVNEPVTISGAGVAGYNGTFTIASLPGGANGTTFTYTDTNGSLANSGGGTATLARGIPISLIGPTSGVTSGTFTLTYDSSDLAISGAVVDPSLAASYGATLSLDASSTPGDAIIDFSTTTALPSASTTPILLGGLVATVPSTAYYKAKDLLHFGSVTLNANGSSVATIGTDALHLVAFAGDASGDGYITSADKLDISRVVAGSDTGFAAYKLTDPDIIADILGDGTVDGPDGAAVDQYVNGGVVPQMPVFPGHPTNMLAGADPTVSIPSMLQVGADGTVTVPVNIDDPCPAGSGGMTDATLALTYDPTMFSVSASDIQLGSVPASGTDWILKSKIDPATGQIAVTIWSYVPISSSDGGSLITITFHLIDLAASGTTSINLVNSVDPANSIVRYTQVDNALGAYTVTLPDSGSQTLVSLDAPTDSGCIAGGTTSAIVAGAVGSASSPGTSSVLAAGAVDSSATSATAAASSSTVGVSPQSAASTGTVPTTPQSADSLFAALGQGTIGADELAALGSDGQQALCQTLAAEINTTASVQANPDQVLWNDSLETD